MLYNKGIHNRKKDANNKLNTKHSKILKTKNNDPFQVIQTKQKITTYYP